MTTIETGKAVLTWSGDGSTVTKRPTDARPIVRRLFVNEQRVMRLLTTDPPPVRVPRVVSARRGHDLVVEAIDGKPLGPKFPLALGADDIEDVVGLVDRLASYRPRRRWLRRFDAGGRIVQSSSLSDADRAAVRRAVDRRPPTLRFAHGDVTARNVMRSATGDVVLIDWEWAGLHPVGYDLAFFWFSLIDVPGGREQVARLEEPWFLLSAIFIQLFHLDMWRARGATEHLEGHLATLDDLLVRVRALT